MGFCFQSSSHKVDDYQCESKINIIMAVPTFGEVLRFKKEVAPSRIGSCIAMPRLCLTLPFNICKTPSTLLIVGGIKALRLHLALNSVASYKA